MAEKLTFEVVRDFFENERGFKLLETEYINSEFPMRYVCTCGQESQMSYKNAKKGRNCKHCGYAKLSAARQKYTYEDVRQLFTNNGCVLLETEYPTPSLKLNYLCVCRNESTTTLSRFQNGHRCKNCRSITVGNAVRKYTMDDVRALFSAQGKKLLEDGDFKNSAQMLRYLCKCGNESATNLNNFLRGRDCAECKRTKLSEAKRDPNITDEDREIKRQYPEYAEWRTAVYEKDAYTCQCCGIKGAKLNAHHIRNYADCRELRTVVSNGMTLCLECHYGFHSQYGKRNTNEAQISEFIRNYTEVIA